MKYNIIYADPPWKYNDNGCGGAAEKHYSCMSLEDIKNLPIDSIAADDCVLFIWATYPLMQEALDVIKSWGFQYKTLAFNWIKLSTTGNKLSFGLGRFTRGNSEPLLLATRGKISAVCHNINEVVMSPNIKHSKKPDKIRDLIVKLMGDLPRVELFARNKTKGWDCWGNEIESDIELKIE